MMNLASVLYDVGVDKHKEEGLDLMRGAVKLDPLNADAHYNHGTLLSRLGKSRKGWGWDRGGGLRGGRREVMGNEIGMLVGSGTLSLTPVHHIYM